MASLLTLKKVSITLKIRCRDVTNTDGQVSVREYYLCQVFRNCRDYLVLYHEMLSSPDEMLPNDPSKLAWHKLLVCTV